MDDKKVVPFKTKKEQEKVELKQENKAFMEYAKQELNNQLDKSSGVIVVSFSDAQDGDSEDPNCFWAGSFDPIKTVGALEMIKSSIMQEGSFSVIQGFDTTLEEDDPNDGE